MDCEGQPDGAVRLLVSLGDTIVPVLEQKETEETWAAQEDALQQLAAACRAVPATAADDAGLLEAQVALVRRVRPGIARSFASDRSRLLKAALAAVAAVAQMLGTTFDALCEPLLPSLVKLCTRANRVVVRYANECLEQAIAASHLVAQTPLLARSLSSANKSLRASAAMCLFRIIETAPLDALAPYADVLQGAIRAGTGDASADVREWSRKGFAAFVGKFPGQRDALLQSLGDPARKSLLSGSSSSGVQRAPLRARLAASRPALVSTSNVEPVRVAAPSDAHRRRRTLLPSASRETVGVEAACDVIPAKSTAGDAARRRRTLLPGAMRELVASDAVTLASDEGSRRRRTLLPGALREMVSNSRDTLPEVPNRRRTLLPGALRELVTREAVNVTESRDAAKSGAAAPPIPKIISGARTKTQSTTGASLRNMRVLEAPSDTPHETQLERLERHRRSSHHFEMVHAFQLRQQQQDSVPTVASRGAARVRPASAAAASPAVTLTSPVAMQRPMRVLASIRLSEASAVTPRVRAASAIGPSASGQAESTARPVTATARRAGTASETLRPNPRGESAADRFQTCAREYLSDDWAARMRAQAAMGELVGQLTAEQLRERLSRMHLMLSSGLSDSHFRVVDATVDALAALLDTRILEPSAPGSAAAAVGVGSAATSPTRLRIVVKRLLEECILRLITIVAQQPSRMREAHVERANATLTRALAAYGSPEQLISHVLLGFFSDVVVAKQWRVRAALLRVLAAELECLCGQPADWLDRRFRSIVVRLAGALVDLDPHARASLFRCFAALGTLRPRLFQHVLSDAAIPLSAGDRAELLADALDAGETTDAVTTAAKNLTLQEPALAHKLEKVDSAVVADDAPFLQRRPTVDSTPVRALGARQAGYQMFGSPSIDELGRTPAVRHRQSSLSALPHLPTCGESPNA